MKYHFAVTLNSEQLWFGPLLGPDRESCRDAAARYSRTYVDERPLQVLVSFEDQAPEQFTIYPYRDKP